MEHRRNSLPASASAKLAIAWGVAMFTIAEDVAVLTIAGCVALLTIAENVSLLTTADDVSLLTLAGDVNNGDPEKLFISEASDLVELTSPESSRCRLHKRV